MAKSRRYLKSKGTARPSPDSHSKIHSPSKPQLSQEGLLTFAEIAVGSLIIALLLVVGVVTLRVTEKGTVAQKKSQQALNLAKAKAEELKSFMGSQNWDRMKVDVRFPATQTPAVNSYNSYAPTTVTLGKNTFIMDPDVR